MPVVTRQKLLVAVFLAVLLLVLLVVRAHRAPEADEVITHEVQDLIATLQQPLEPGDATPWNEGISRDLLGFVAAFFAILGLAGTVWIVRTRRARQQRSRRSSS